MTPEEKLTAEALAELWIEGLTPCHTNNAINKIRLASDAKELINQELAAAKESIKELLPLIEEPYRLTQDCVMGYDEVKFCSIRNGEGNQCMRCFDKTIISRAKALLEH